MLPFDQCIETKFMGIDLFINSSIQLLSNKIDCWLRVSKNIVNWMNFQKLWHLRKLSVGTDVNCQVLNWRMSLWMWTRFTCRTELLSHQTFCLHEYIDFKAHEKIVYDAICVWRLPNWAETMSTKAKPNKLCQGKDAFERMNFLYQAASQMAGKNRVLSSYYGNMCKSISKKSVLRL